MSRIALLALSALLVAGPALAQSSRGTADEMNSPRSSSARMAARHAAHPRAHSPGPPIDVGPFTPEANRAFMGGGAVLEGTPGGPPPEPHALPPEASGRDALPPATR